MLHIETAIDPLFLHTLRLHFNYCNKILSLPEFRLPRIVAVELISKNVGFFRQWAALAQKYSPEVNFSLSNFDNWRKYQSDILIKIKDSFREESLRRARGTERFLLYRTPKFRWT